MQTQYNQLVAAALIKISEANNADNVGDLLTRNALIAEAVALLTASVEPKDSEFLKDPLISAALSQEQREVKVAAREPINMAADILTRAS